MACPSVYAPRRLSRIQSPGPRVVRRAVDCCNVDAYLATERALPQGAKDPALPADPLPELSQATCSVILCFAPASPGGQIRSLQSSCSGAVIVGYDAEIPAVVSPKTKKSWYTQQYAMCKQQATHCPRNCRYAGPTRACCSASFYLYCSWLTHGVRYC